MSIRDQAKRLMEQGGGVTAQDTGMTVSSPGPAAGGKEPELGQAGLGAAASVSGTDIEGGAGPVGIAGDWPTVAGKQAGGHAYSPVKGAGEIAGGHAADQDIPGRREVLPDKDVRRSRSRGDARSTAPEREPRSPLETTESVDGLIRDAIDRVLRGEDASVVAKRLLHRVSGE